MLNARNIDFLLYEMLDTDALLERARYQDHSREVFDAVISSASDIAAKYLWPHYQKADAHEPTFDGRTVHLVPETKVAWDVIRNAGFLKAHCDEDEGGLQLPEVILRTSMGHFLAANCPSSSYYFLTLGVINLIRTFGDARQKQRFLPRLAEGEFAGTMALTEPGQGSALADIRTRAEPQVDGTYKIFGQKMFITAGEHNLTENIIHMVLAKIKGAPPGAKGISLFIVPKFLVDDDGSVGRRNDVALAGLLHKMGNRNATSTVLNFGEKDGAIGYLIGGEGKGLTCMFQMMNEARIGVGLSAAAIASTGFQHSLAYARERPQGRLPSNRDPVTPQVMLTEHADVRRLLLTQKSYVEGALALCLYASSLFEDERTHPDLTRRSDAGELLSLLTPVVKSWPSKYGCQSNELAIQVLGGAGYIREFPLEQLYRDQRLNPIHEGAEGIHGLDLLGRKITANNGAALELLKMKVLATVTAAAAVPELADLAHRVKIGFELLLTTTQTLILALPRDADRGLANATAYLDMFGRVVVAWLWLWQALLASQRMPAAAAKVDDHYFYRGKLQAARYYIEWELRQIAAVAELLCEPNAVPFEMHNDWF